MPARGCPAKHVQMQLEQHHSLDFDQDLNTSSYVNVKFEKEEAAVAMMGAAINIADQTVYPESFKVHNMVLDMVANLWHAPKEDVEQFGVHAGAGTVGSTEACLLAGLALKFRWREWYGKKNNLTAEQVLGERPNLVISCMYQACWEKFFKYMDVQPKFVVPKYEDMVVSAEQIIAEIDDHTIGVVAIMGNHYTGHYDPVWEIDAALTKFNKESGLQVGIHVDGASGGFIAPFQQGLPAWDFRLPNVLSISASGHKFGQSICGTGWVVWRQRKNLSEHVSISVSYLGGHADSYTLNFSRPASGIYVQAYKFLRLGREGYQGLCTNMMAVATQIRAGLKSMKHSSGKPRFVMLDNGDTHCLPVVTAMLNPELELDYDDIDLQHTIAQDHWYVSGYHMSFGHPITEETLALLVGQPVTQTMFRVVVKCNLTPALGHNLVEVIENAVAYLDKHEKTKIHTKKPKGCSRKAAC